MMFSLLLLLVALSASPLSAHHVECPTPLVASQIKVGDILLICDRGATDGFWLPFAPGDVVRVLAVQAPLLRVQKVGDPFFSTTTYAIPTQYGVKLMKASEAYIQSLILPPPE